MASECTIGSPTGLNAIFHHADTWRDRMDTYLAQSSAEAWCAQFQEQRPNLRLRHEEWTAIRDAIISAILHGQWQGRFQAECLARNVETGTASVPVD